MRAGRLRHRLTFLAAAVTENTRGGRTKTYRAFLRDVPGEIVPMSGAEQEVAQKIVAGVTHQYVTRWYASLAAKTPKDLRIEDGSRTFEVGYQVDPEGRRRMLRGMAKEIAA
jgi:SPP1 family predicted phage head-tail adaptor